jgi:hypothetical protein
MFHPLLEEMPSKEVRISRLRGTLHQGHHFAVNPFFEEA